MEKIECFKIRLNKSLEPLNKNSWIKVIDIKGLKLIGEPSTIMADPFLFVKHDTLYVFYEDKKMYQHGVISMISTRDLINWTTPVVVLREDCHLSYPWVFEENGFVYMIPETCGLKSIRLYKGNNDLTEFNYIKTILSDDKQYSEGFSFSDSSFFLWNGKYYLMTTINDGQENILRLYFSNCFDGGYVEHPESPICSSNKYGRNAGALFEFKGKIYRVAQDCEIKYGDNVNLLEVKELSPFVYREEKVMDNIIPIDFPFYQDGGHHFNIVKFKDEYIISTDAKEYHYMIIRKALHKLGGVIR